MKIAPVDWVEVDTDTAGVDVAKGILQVVQERRFEMAGGGMPARGTQSGQK